MTEQATYLPHANLDPSSRHSKAAKIDRLLEYADLPDRPSLQLLEVGTGAGSIAAYFGNHGSRAWEVAAVDRVDQRQEFDGYHFQLVSDVTLPFPDKSFDVVISNHVIEHVGESASQLRHLQEMLRVLRCDGVIYLACPNRWQWVEPHYRVAMLSWWPRHWRSRYLTLRGRGGFYDCEPLSKGALERLLARAPLVGRNVCAEAVSDVLEHELQRHPLARVLRHVPLWLWRGLAGICPTHVYFLTKQS